MIPELDPTTGAILVLVIIDRGIVWLGKVAKIIKGDPIEKLLEKHNTRSEAIGKEVTEIKQNTDVIETTCDHTHQRIGKMEVICACMNTHLQKMN